MPDARAIIVRFAMVIGLAEKRRTDRQTDAEYSKNNADINEDHKRSFSLFIQSPSLLPVYNEPESEVYVNHTEIESIAGSSFLLYLSLRLHCVV